MGCECCHAAVPRAQETASPFDAHLSTLDSYAPSASMMLRLLAVGTARVSASARDPLLSELTRQATYQSHMTILSSQIKRGFLIWILGLTVGSGRQ